MPSDANGVFSLPSGSTAVTGEIIQASTHNTPIEDLATGMSQRLMRSGVAPMTGALKIADGAVGSPGVQFNSSTSTGFYKTPSGIGVSVNGTKVAEFTSSGLSRMIGELIPWTLLSAPDGWVFPYGQTLSRTTYAALWTIAQDEISNGNSFFNSGDGSTTFGIGDLRGRGLSGKDDMGGTAASRLTSSYFGTDATVLGATGGAEKQTLTTSQMPSHYHSAGTYDPGHYHLYDRSNQNLSGGSGFGSANPGYGNYNQTSTTTVSTGVRINSSNGLDTTYSAGGGGAHNNTQPTMICNYLLYAGA